MSQPAIASCPGMGWRRAELGNSEQDRRFMAGMDKLAKNLLLDTTRCSMNMSTPGESISTRQIPENIVQSKPLGDRVCRYIGSCTKPRSIASLTARARRRLCGIGGQVLCVRWCDVHRVVVVLVRCLPFRIIEMLTIKNQIAGGKLAMIAGPHPPAL